MSDYLPSFIVEPVLRQARRFSERVGGEDSPGFAAGTGFSLPAVPDFQRFYPTRFWNHSPPLAPTDSNEPLAALGQNVQEEGTLRSIARNIQLWANQINNLEVEDEVLQDPVLPLVEPHDAEIAIDEAVLTEEPENLETANGSIRLALQESARQPTARSLPLRTRARQAPRTNSETSINPAHELSFQSQVLEHHAQGRSQSVPFAALNVGYSGRPRILAESGGDYTDDGPVQTRTGSGALPEDDGMRPLRRKINAIWAGPGTAQEKSRLVHTLMTERYRLSQNALTPASSSIATSPPLRAASPFSLASVRSDDVSFNLSSTDLQPTYAPLGADETPDQITGEMPKPDLGCVHYKRNVKMQCASCDRWYTCRLCHDEAEDHQLPRKDTKHMLCMVCSTPQRASQACKTCYTQAAYYYCSICKLWNNDPDRSIYHCDDCGICRLGEGLGKDFFHCKTCAACISIQAESDHRCIERSTKCDCPICGEYMFTSSQPVTFMRCGHSIHDTCFMEWCNTSYKCPICSKSIANMESQFRRLDRHIEEQPMPEEYGNNRAYVFCNDCNSRSVVKFHWLGLKCAVCDSYNTAQLEVLGPESPALQERADRAQEMGVGEAGMTASQSQTPTGDLASPAARSIPGQATPATAGSLTRQGSGPGTPMSAIGVPNRRDSPFHNLPNSPSRSIRAMSPVVGSYFGTGQRTTPGENRRGSYFSALSFGATNDESGAVNALAHAMRQTRPNSSRLSQSHLSPELAGQDIPQRGATPLEDDDDMDFWGGHSPRSHDADIVDLSLENESEEEESSTDEEDNMDYDDDADEEDDPMDILIGHR